MGAAAASTYSVAVEPRRRAVVLDATLALSRYGLLLAQKLSSEYDVWVSRHLWSILDDSSRYLGEPKALALFASGSSPEIVKTHPVEETMRQAVQQWDVARAEKDLAGMRLHWIGESLGSSLLPGSADPNLVSRFETLLAELDARCAHEIGFEAKLRDCAKDALALSVALSPQRAIVFTAFDAEARRPVFCELIDELWGIPSHPVSDAQRAKLLRSVFDGLFHHTGIIDLGWAGLRFAAVHLVAHRAAAIPSFGSVTEDGDFRRLESDLTDGDWFEGAVAFWYPLNWC